jgi:hypothetical protein
MFGEDFPSINVDVLLGDWWRIHSDGYGPWRFSSCDLPIREEVDIGRFDLLHPHGTCYLGAYPLGAAAEIFREAGVEAPAAQRAADARRLSQMSLKRWSGERFADFTSRQTVLQGAPEDIAGLTRAEARPWAQAAHEAGFKGSSIGSVKTRYDAVGWRSFTQRASIRRTTIPSRIRSRSDCAGS